MTKTALKSALGKTLHYLLAQRPYLIRYLGDGRLELSNNRTERSIKPFVMGRKNSLFANMPAGAQSSAVIYSLIETAKKHLNPTAICGRVLEKVPTPSQEDTSWAEYLTPANALRECHIPPNKRLPSRYDCAGMAVLFLWKYPHKRKSSSF